MKKIAIINGPNLNLLGKREPEKYGKENFDKYFENIQAKFTNISLNCFQSNSEPECINAIQKFGFEYDGIIINPAALTHQSFAMADAISAIPAPVIELHITNTLAREAFRKHSYLSSVCIGSVVGLGIKGYEIAISYFID